MDMGEKEIWVKPLAGGEVAVCFMNRTEQVWHLDHNWQGQAVYFAEGFNPFRKEYTVRDLWQHKEIGTTKQHTRADIPPHGVLMVRLKEKGK